MGNRIKNITERTLHKGWATLSEIFFDYKMSAGNWTDKRRESYNRGDGATIILYNKEKGTVILVKQFRVSAYLNQHKTGFIIEACAGMLDDDSPETCIIREVEEETGYKLPKVTKLFDAYSSPGALTEKLHYFVGEYTSEMKVSSGGGVDTEQEDIEIIEMPFKTALQGIETGEIADAKTIILLQYLQINNLV
ncbi:nudix-type nucleoside diphosphatase (YffH/AdpP family) [Lacinutrix venerupis]|uniref:NUDIX domain-containing protein n=1 Tax=Lacinutrix venerupis TaxID=1486034 RepID=UPI000EB1BCAF|nr:NUDIX domain-containing protein [Lacinutrix venerupis]RLJ68755.1 nudix-type nucleoside diphosphatase (YffH/AdpP family) [Lacinutrix venerupis]